MPTLADFDDLLAVALAAALLSFSDTMVTARAFAARNRYRIDANQELLGIGMANLMSGVSQGCVGGPLRLWYTSAHGSPGAPRSATSRAAAWYPELSALDF